MDSISVLNWIILLFAFNTSSISGQLSSIDKTSSLTSTDYNLSSSSTLPETRLSDGIIKFTKVSENYWCPKEASNSEWFQIEFNTLKTVIYISSYMKFYKKIYGDESLNDAKFYIKYQREDGEWFNYTDDAQNRLPFKFSAQPMRELRPRIIAKKIRLMPFYDERGFSMSSQNTRPLICLSVSFIGNEFYNGLMEYQMSDGDTFNGHSLMDGFYESPRLQGRLTGGLGLLTDKLIYRGDNIVDATKKNALVGWNIASRQADNVTIVFRFNSTRQFKSIQVYSFVNKAKLGNSHPSKLIIETSIGGQIYNHYAKVYQFINKNSNLPMTDENRVDLVRENLIGKFLRLTIVTESDWIILSEVTFDSDEYNEHLDVEEIPEEIRKPILFKTLDPNANPFEEALGNEDPPIKNMNPWSNEERSINSESDSSTFSNLEADLTTMVKKDQIQQMNQTLVTIIISISVPILVIFLTIFLFLIFRWRFCGHRRDKKLAINHNNMDHMKGPMNSNDFYEVPILNSNYNPNQPIMPNGTMLNPEQLIKYTSQFYSNNNPQDPNSYQNQNYLALGMLLSGQTLMRPNPQQQQADSQPLLNQNQQVFLPINFNTMQTNNSGQSSGGSINNTTQKTTQENNNYNKNMSLTTSAGSYSSSSGQSSGHDSQRMNMSLPPPPNQSPPPVPDNESNYFSAIDPNNEYASTSILNGDMNAPVNQINWNYQQTLINPHTAFLLAQQQQLSLQQAMQNQQPNYIYRNQHPMNNVPPQFQPPSTPPGAKGKQSKSNFPDC